MRNSVLKPHRGRKTKFENKLNAVLELRAQLCKIVPDLKGFVVSKKDHSSQ
jgi:hypothetical protein